MSIKKYEVLLQTADLGSFTKASEVLGYTQSAISHIITGLEDELGLKLLARDRFGVRLTAEGEALLPAIRAVCQQNQELLRQAAQFHGLEVGQVRIGTWLSVSVHLLPRLLQTFSQRHPDITFELLQGSYEDIERWLSEGRIDLGFLRLPASGHFETTLLLEERILAIFPPNQAPACERVTVEQLKQSPYILRLDSLDNDTRELFRKTQHTPRITYSAKDDYAVMAMVEQGLGISILPELVLRKTNYQVAILPTRPVVMRKIGLVMKDKNTMPIASKYFIEFLFQHINQLP